MFIIECAWLPTPPLFTMKNASISEINIEKASIGLACYPIRSQPPREWSSSLRTISTHQYGWRNTWSSDNSSRFCFFNTSTPNGFVLPNARTGMYQPFIHASILKRITPATPKNTDWLWKPTCHKETSLDLWRCQSTGLPCPLAFPNFTACERYFVEVNLKF